MEQFRQIFDLLAAIFGDIGITDIFDIVLVSYAVYRALLFIEGTRAFNLLKGIGIILVLYVVTKNMNFNTVSWVLSTVLPTGFLALVVIFQPELRRAPRRHRKRQVFRRTAHSRSIYLRNDR